MEDKVKQVLSEVIPEYEDYEGVDFVKDGIIDSFILLELISEIEEEFEIEIPREWMKSSNFRNIPSIIGMIEKCKKEN